jgi:signal transduction histidine kinase
MAERGSLKKRITLTIILGMSVILLSSGIVSYNIIQKSIEAAINKKLVLSRLIRDNIDNVLKDNINRLYDISLSGSVDLNDNDMGPETNALNTAYRYSIFRDGIFMLDRGGNVILNYPEKISNINLNLLSVEPVSRAVATGRPVVSNIYITESSKKRVLFVIVPLKDKNGNSVGIVAGEIDPTNPVLTGMLKLTEADQNTFIDLLDSNGIVIASSDPNRTLTFCCEHNKFYSSIISARKEHVATCHQCHDIQKREKTTNIAIFVPLEMAPWGVSIQEPEKDVFAPSTQLKIIFAALGVVFLGTAFILSTGITRSVLNPINALIRATNRIARGDMTKPVSVSSNDEIGILSQSFDTMRVKLNESLLNIKNYNLELENRVRERTMQIKNSQERIAMLLKKVMSTQEDERKRIARELHDETVQYLSAILMKIELCKLQPDNISPQKIEEIWQIVLKTLEGLNIIIKDLRPPLLDDLGLESAISWLIDSHLTPKQINCFCNIKDTEYKRFSPEVEINLFRIAQETIVNIDKHANAHNVFILLKIIDKQICMDIEDDGAGFDAEAMLQKSTQVTKDLRGIGLLDMKERAALIGGMLKICSSPGSGTRVSLKIPIESVGGEYV